MGFYQLYKKLQSQKKIVAFVGYAIFISIVFVVMPPNPDEISAPMELVNDFRTMSVIAVSVFWVSVATILGIFWSKFRPDSQIKLEKY